MKISKEKLETKHIKLHIDGKIFQDLQLGIGLKKVRGNFYGPEDEFIFLVVKSIMDGKEEITIIPKKRKKTENGKKG